MERFGYKRPLSPPISVSPETTTKEEQFSLEAEEIVGQNDDKPADKKLDVDSQTLEACGFFSGSEPLSLILEDYPEKKQNDEIYENDTVSVTTTTTIAARHAEITTIQCKHKVMSIKEFADKVSLMKPRDVLKPPITACIRAYVSYFGAFPGGARLACPQCQSKRLITDDIHGECPGRKCITCNYLGPLQEFLKWLPFSVSLMDNTGELYNIRIVNHDVHASLGLTRMINVIEELPYLKHSFLFSPWIVTVQAAWNEELKRPTCLVTQMTPFDGIDFDYGEGDNGQDDIIDEFQSSDQ